LVFFSLGKLGKGKEAEFQLPYAKGVFYANGNLEKLQGKDLSVAEDCFFKKFASLKEEYSREKHSDELYTWYRFNIKSLTEVRTTVSHEDYEIDTKSEIINRMGRDDDFFSWGYFVDIVDE